jgi:4'-phosphopantetheinyl transferase
MAEVEIYWHEETTRQLPPGNEWLSPDELARLETMRFEKRRSDWRLGRWTAKRAIARCLAEPPPLASIEIRTAPSGAPEVALPGFTISLSHRAGIGACAVVEGAAAVGCDLELVEPRSLAFIEAYLTAGEQRLVAGIPPARRDFAVALLWSAKESALKALGVGLRADTREVEVAFVGGTTALSINRAWRPLVVRHLSGREFHGWWRVLGGVVRTVVCDPPPYAPPTSAGRTRSRYAIA